jgi:hypothetical protein
MDMTTADEVRLESRRGTRNYEGISKTFLLPRVLLSFGTFSGEKRWILEEKKKVNQLPNECMTVS